MIFTSLHFISSHNILNGFQHTFFSLTHVSNRFPYPLFQSIRFAGERRYGVLEKELDLSGTGYVPVAGLFEHAWVSEQTGLSSPDGWQLAALVLYM
jgi:hypothetical protein